MAISSGNQVLDGLNEAQLSAVTAGDVPLLVVAGAGSGKTRVITHRVAWLMQRGIGPSRILLLTFTNRAASDMLERVARLTNVDLKGFWGGTFHSVANRFLRLHSTDIGFEGNFTILDRNDSVDMLSLIRKETFSSSEAGYFPAPRLLAECFSYAANTGLPLDAAVAARLPDFDGEIELLFEIQRKFTETKRLSNVMDFDDLLLNFRKVLQKSSNWSSRFSHLLVDEFQDTNALQFDLLDCLTGEGCVPCVVGDDAQSIYSFRGADPGNLKRFPNFRPGSITVKLEKNYRSTPQILALANNSIRHNASGIEKTLYAASEDGARPRVIPLSGQGTQAAYISSRIVEYIDEGVPPACIAVLYRSHFASLELQFKLQRDGLPYAVRSGLKYFETAHVKDAMAFLRTGVNRKDVGSWFRILTMLPGVGPVSASRALGVLSGRDGLLETGMGNDVAKVLPARSRDAWEHMSGNLDEVARACAEEDPELAISTVLKGPYPDYLKNKYDNYESRLDDLSRLAGFASGFKNVSDFISEVFLADSSTGDEPGREKNQDREIILSTVHQAKGLEWDIVFVLGMCDGIFPSSRVEGEDEYEEERRLFYVAVTRARRELLITFPMFNDGGRRGRYEMAPSPFLEELDTEVYDLEQDVFDDAW